MTKVASYCRVSTDKEDQYNSMDAQRRYFSEYIQRNPDWELYDIYADEGITGTSTKKRTQFNRMMSDAYSGKFQVIITKEVSRFSRNTLDTLTYTRELRELGINVIFMNDGFCSKDPDSELRITIMGSIAQEESRKTSSRVTWGQQRQMEQGIVFGHSLLGYDVINGKMRIDPEGAELVRLIFQKYALEKTGTTELARFLQKEGYRTSTGNTKWSNSHLIKILKNEKYVGDLVQRKTYTPNYLTHEKKPNHGQVEQIIIRDHHQAIVDRELWKLAQEELKKNNKHNANSGAHSNMLLFSGKIRCGECHSRFVSRRKTTQDGSGYRRWSCSGSTIPGTDKCHVGKLLRDDDALNMIKTVVQKLSIDKESIISNVTMLALHSVQAGECSITNTPDQIKYHLQKNREKKIRLLDAFLEGMISKTEWQIQKQKYDEQMDSLQIRLTAAEHQEMSGTEAEQQKTELRKQIRSILDGETESIILYKILLEQITVFKDRHLELVLNHLPLVFHFCG